MAPSLFPNLPLVDSARNFFFEMVHELDSLSILFPRQELFDPRSCR